MLASGPDLNHSLCHGQLGNMELLAVAVRAGHPELAAEWAAWATRALATFETSGPVCGTPGGIATPGLMVGLAGIGHGLLRLGFPDRVPSVLLLEPPKTRP
jgi:lantibiotic modifying enzyme